MADGVGGLRDGSVLHLAAVGLMAHRVPTRMHGGKTYFNTTQQLNNTNICVQSCKFCAFAAKEGDACAYLMPPPNVQP